jgi:hypothetical protein
MPLSFQDACSRASFMKPTHAGACAQVRKACAATYLFKSSGTCVNLRVGRSGAHSPAQLLDNIHAALAGAVQHIPKKWDNIQVCVCLLKRAGVEEMNDRPQGACTYMMASWCTYVSCWYMCLGYP